jgi:CRP-like cAMP-binding protein
MDPQQGFDVPTDCTMDRVLTAGARVADAEDAKQNRLLAWLPEEDWQRWRPHLERVDLHAGQVVHEQGRPQAHAYFPTSAILSVSHLLEGGGSTEVALVGAEGMVGMCLLLDGGTTTTLSSVLIGGQAFRIAAQTIRAEFDRSQAVRQLFLRYIQALTTQIAQSAVCFRHHTVDQQVCGWLVHCLDRLPGSEVGVTQEVLGSMLGVRRESVTHAAGRLRDAGIIRYGRGHIVVIDPAALEQRACECHGVIKREYDRLLPLGPDTEGR